jgi:hypothetical protein
LQTERNQVARIAAERSYLNLDRAALPLALHPGFAEMSAVISQYFTRT